MAPSHLQNLQLLPAWAAAAGTKVALAALPAGHPLVEPLRPANQAEGSPHQAYAAQAAQQQQHPALDGIDWTDPQQVTALLHWLHFERVRRHGQPPPPDQQQQQQ